MAAPVTYFCGIFNRPGTHICTCYRDTIGLDNGLVLNRRPGFSQTNADLSVCMSYREIIFSTKCHKWGFHSRKYSDSMLSSTALHHNDQKINKIICRTLTAKSICIVLSPTWFCLQTKSEERWTTKTMRVVRVDTFCGQWLDFGHCLSINFSGIWFNWFKI